MMTGGIAVANQKGGCSKTSVVANLGIGLAMEGKKVAVIDADPQGSLTASLGYQEPDDIRYTLATIMMNIINVYSHILDDDRKRNAELFEEAFYGKKNLNPQMIDSGAEKMITVPEGVNAETLMKVLGNPEMVALLSSLAKTIQK